MRTLIFAGGGTAGHVTPNLALIPYCNPYFDRICYVGESGGYEETAAKRYGIEFFGLSAVKFDRSKMLKNLLIPSKLSKAVKAADAILGELNPSLLFVKGGYVSLPPALAARKRGIPVVCHESDCSLGLANKLIAPFSEAVLTAFPNTVRNGIAIGNPVRDEIFSPKPIEYPFSKKQPVVLVTGGSSGAKIINETVKETVALLPDFNFLHIVGKSAVDVAADNYYAIPFSNNIADLYALADVVLCRAGACTLSELTALGKRTLAVPLPKGVSRGDQQENAERYRSLGLIRTLQQEELTPCNLAQAIKASFFSPQPVSEYDWDTPKKIAELIDSLALRN